MTLLGNSIPLPFLRRKEVINGKPAKAEIVRVVGGNARFLAEWTTGKTFGFDSLTETDPPCAPLTGNVPHESSGEAVGPGPGHDHSGGVMGKPIVRNVWMANYGSIPDGIYDGTTPVATLDATHISADIVDTRTNVIWVPWSMSDGAYASLYWLAYVHGGSGGASNYAVEVSNAMTRDRIYEEGSLTTGYQTITLAREIMCAPGMFNQIFCKVNATYVASTTDVTVLSWGLFQIKTDP